MKSNLRETIHYIDESTLEKAKNEKVQKQESPSKMSKDVEESVDKMISNRMSKAYSEWKSNQDTRPYNENIEKEYQKLLETLSPDRRVFLSPGYKGWTEIKKYGKICIRNDVVKSEFVCEKSVNKRMLICVACGNGSFECRVELSKSRRKRLC